MISLLTSVLQCHLQVPIQPLAWDNSSDRPFIPSGGIYTHFRMAHSSQRSSRYWGPHGPCLLALLQLVALMPPLAPPRGHHFCPLPGLVLSLQSIRIVEVPPKSGKLLYTICRKAEGAPHIPCLGFCFSQCSMITGVFSVVTGAYLY